MPIPIDKRLFVFQEDFNYLESNGSSKIKVCSHHSLQSFCSLAIPGTKHGSIL